jgi:predicted metal-dependent hydrolase
MSKPETIQTSVGPAKLKRSQRKTLAISVLPDGTLELVAPLESTLEAILLRVKKRENWIFTQRRNFKVMNAERPPLRYVNGATHRYLGRQYRLKIEVGEKAEGVTLRGGYFHIRLPHVGDTEVKEALETWYRQHARVQFERRMAPWVIWCRHRRLPKPQLRLRTMAKRWGSALKSGVIYLNPELIKAPSVCIDYVITHEICHLKHPDHGSKFRTLLQQLCPGWQRIKERLEGGE